MGQSRPFGAPPVNVWVTLDHGHWADTPALLGSANNGSRSIDSISSSVRPAPHFRIAKKAPISGAASLTGVSSRLIGWSQPRRSLFLRIDLKYPSGTIFDAKLQAEGRAMTIATATPPMEMDGLS